MNDKVKFPFRFFVVTFLWSWLIWLPLVLMGFEIISIEQKMLSIIRMPILVLAVFGPAVGAFFSLRTLKGKGEITKFLKSFLSLRFGWRVWVLTFVLFAGSTALAWYIPEFFGEDRIGMLLPNIYIFPAYWLLMVFLGGGQEEIGWRAYILPYLEDHFDRWTSSIILAFVWSIWHLPLWFIPGTAQKYMNFAGFIMLTLGYSFIQSWVMKSSGNRPMAGLIVHGTANAFVPVFPVVIFTLNISQPRYWIWVSLTLIMGIAVLALDSFKTVKLKVS